MSRAGTALLLAALALATAGCAGLPERGPVEPASRIEAPRVQVWAKAPSAGDTAEGIVKGFLAAGRDFHQNHAIARLYIDDAGSPWQALEPVVVLDDDPCIRLVSVDGVEVRGAADTTACSVSAAVRTEPAPKPPRPRDGQTATVRVSGWVQARIDELGHYRATAGRAPFQHDFTLVARGREWRITGPPDGLVLPAWALRQAFSPVPLYFPQRLGDPGPDGSGAGAGAVATDPSGARTWLVPDVRWFPLDLEPAAIASMAVRGLLGGPSPWLGAAVDSGAGRDVTLAPLAGVQIVDGVARVDLSKPPPQRRVLRSQVLATLQALPAGTGGVPVTDVTFTVGQVALDVPSGPVPAVWPAATEAPPGQSGLEQRGGVASGAPLCLTAKGQVGDLRVAEQSSCVAREELAPLARPGASVPASDRREGLFAVLSTGRDAVWAMTPGARDATPVLRGRQLTAPSVDGTGQPGRGWLWAASSVPGGPLVASTLEAARQVTVDVPWLRGGRITAVRISPEGSRALLVVQRASRTEVLVSGVVRAVGGRPLRLVGPPLSLVPDLVSAADAVWRGADHVAVLGVRAGSPQTFVWTAQVGGEIETLVSSPVTERADGLAVSGTGVDVYVRTAGGRRALGTIGGQWTTVAVRALAMPG